MAGPYFWVGGSGNTSDATNHWATVSGGVPNAANVPTSADNVSFDILSNTTAYTVTVDATFNCKDMTWALPAVSGVPTLAGASGLVISGNLSCVTGLLWTHSGGVTFSGATAGKTILSSGVSINSSLTFNAAGGWTFSDGSTVPASRTVNVQAGTIVTGAFTHSWGNFQSTSGTRALTLDNSTINITGTSGTPWNVSTAGTLTFSATGSTININGGTAGGAMSLTPATLTYGAFNITATGILTLNGTPTFKNFSYTSTTDKRDALQLAAAGFNVAASGSLTIAGNSTVNRAFIVSTVLGTQRTITVPNTATVSISNTDFQDIASAGTFGTWTGTSLGDCLGNSGITFDASVTLTLASTGTVNWDSATWTSSGAARTAPLPQDDVVLPSAISTTLSGNMPRLGRNITATNYNRTLNITSFLSTIFGNITLGSSMTFLTTAQFTLSGRGSQTITSAGKSFNNVQIAAFGGSYTLQDSLVSTGNFTVSNGTFDSQGFDVSAVAFNSNVSTTREIKGTSVSTWAFSAAASNIWLPTSSLTVTNFSATIKFTGNISTTGTFVGAGLTYRNFWWANTAATGSLIFTGANTFADFKINRTTARTITWPSATTNTIASWTDESLGVAVLTLTASTPGSAAILTKATGFVSTNYLSISDSNAPASPDGSIWFAGSNSVSTSGANTRWRFASINTILGGGQMLLRGVGG